MGPWKKGNTTSYPISKMTQNGASPIVQITSVNFNQVLFQLFSPLRCQRQDSNPRSQDCGSSVLPLCYQATENPTRARCWQARSSGTMYRWRHDIQYNNNRHNATQHNDIQHDDIQQNYTKYDDTELNDTQHKQLQSAL